MKQIFDKYSKYYDLIYREKDYENEVEYITSLILKHNPNAKTILDLGCGTGIHANLLAKKGFSVTGVDYSSEMIKIANNKKSNEYLDNINRLDFIVGDIKSIKLDKKFDVVISIFHVFSYLNSNADIHETIHNIDTHLNKNDGLLIFDFWYGPGVLTELPTERHKTFKNQDLIVNRYSTPVLKTFLNIVEVNYRIQINDMSNNSNHEIFESHSMRYFFQPELTLFLEKIKSNGIYFYDWMKFEEPKQGSWNACVILNR